MNTITAHDVLTEFQVWLAQQPASPAREWVMANPPGAGTAQGALSTRRLTQTFLNLLYPPRICTWCNADLAAHGSAQPVLYREEPTEEWMCLDERGCERRQAALLRGAFAGWGPFGAELARSFRPQPLMLEAGPSWHSNCPQCPQCRSHRHAGECGPT